MEKTKPLVPSLRVLRKRISWYALRDLNDPQVVKALVSLVGVIHQAYGDSHATKAVADYKLTRVYVKDY